jgi:hypothetical protein
MGLQLGQGVAARADGRHEAGFGCARLVFPVVSAPVVCMAYAA